MTSSASLSPQASELKFITGLYQYEQLISEPTRVTKDTRTLIDHFYTTNPDNIISKGVSTVSISDHYLIYGIRKFNRIPNRIKNNRIPRLQTFQRTNILARPTKLLIRF